MSLRTMLTVMGKKAERLPFSSTIVWQNIHIHTVSWAFMVWSDMEIKLHPAGEELGNRPRLQCTGLMAFIINRWAAVNSVMNLIICY